MQRAHPDRPLVEVVHRLVEEAGLATARVTQNPRCTTPAIRALLIPRPRGATAEELLKPGPVGQGDFPQPVGGQGVAAPVDGVGLRGARAGSGEGPRPGLGTRGWIAVGIGVCVHCQKWIE